MSAIRSDESSPVAEQRPPLDLGQAQEFWVREADRWDGTSGRFGDAMLEAAALEPGQRVLDVGCGAGSTTIEAARRVAPTGAAVGVDISGPALALARERAVASGVDGVELHRSGCPGASVRARGLRRRDQPLRDDVLRRSGGGVRQPPTCAAAGRAAGRRGLAGSVRERVDGRRRQGGDRPVRATARPRRAWRAGPVRVRGRRPVQERGHGGWLPGRDARGGHAADADGERCRGRRRHGRCDAPEPRVSLPVSPRRRCRQRSPACGMPSLRTRVPKAS